MNCVKAEEYFVNCLANLSDEKKELSVNINMIKAELEETDIKIAEIKENIDKAYEVFSPRLKSNDFAANEIEKLTKDKEKLLESLQLASERYEEIEKNISIFDEILTSPEEDSDDEQSDLDESDILEDEISNNQGLEEKFRELGIELLEKYNLEEEKIADMLINSVEKLENIVYKNDISMKIVDSDMGRAKLEMNNISKELRETIKTMNELIKGFNIVEIKSSDMEVVLNELVENVKRDSDADIILEIHGEKRELSEIVKREIIYIINKYISKFQNCSKKEVAMILIDYCLDSINIEINDSCNFFDFPEEVKSEEIIKYKESLFYDVKRRILLLSGNIKMESHIREGTHIRITFPIKNCN